MTAPPEPESRITVRMALLTTAVGLLTLLFSCASVEERGEVRRERVTVLFTYEGRAGKVCLGGEFNDWSPTSHCLARDGSVWGIEVVLSPGRYQYGFFVDDERWIHDPNAFFQEDDGFGKKNSLLIVE